MPSERLSTEIVQVDPQEPEAPVIARAAAVLRGGGLVAFPTETVYGLGANALDASAVARIFAAKGRPSNNPLIVHVTGAEAAQHLVTDWPQTAARLAERFWPGPLTLVLPRRDLVPDIVTAGGPTVAVRAPAHPVAQALLHAAQVPVAAPSANRSTRLSPTQAEHVVKGLRGRIEIILDGGPTSGGLESTVLDLTADPPCLLRPGLVTPLEIEAIIGPIQRTGATSTTPEAPLPSPGLLARHYAPRVPLELAEEDDGRERVQALLSRGETVGWVTWSEVAEFRAPGLERVVLLPEPAAYAARLYATLHRLEEAGVTRIVVALPPDTEAWLAVRDRLRRAAHPEHDRNTQSAD